MVNSSAQQGAKQGGILLCEEIKALEAMIVLHLGFRQAMQSLDADFWGGDGRDELEVALIGRLQDFSQGWQTVDGLFHRRPLHRGGAIPMLHLAVLLEEGDIVDGGFDAQDQVEFIVQLDRNGSHLMFEATSQPALVEAVTHLALVIADAICVLKRWRCQPV